MTGLMRESKVGATKRHTSYRRRQLPFQGILASNGLGRWAGGKDRYEPRCDKEDEQADPTRGVVVPRNCQVPSPVVVVGSALDFESEHRSCIVNACPPR